MPENYFKSAAEGGINSGMPSAPARFLWDGGASDAGRMEVYKPTGSVK